MAPLFGGVSSLEDCNLGTAKRNPGPPSFDRGNVHHYRFARLRAAPAPRACPGPANQFFTYFLMSIWSSEAE